MIRKLLVCAAALVASAASGADAPAVQEFRTQKVGDNTYFHVRFETPRNLVRDQETPAWRPWMTGGFDPVLAPRLVAAGDQARHVYPRRDLNAGRGRLE